MTRGCYCRWSWSLFHAKWISRATNTATPTATAKCVTSWAPATVRPSVPVASAVKPSPVFPGPARTCSTWGWSVSRSFVVPPHGPDHPLQILQDAVPFLFMDGPLPRVRRVSSQLVVRLRSSFKPRRCSNVTSERTETGSGRPWRSAAGFVLGPTSENRPRVLRKPNDRRRVHTCHLLPKWQTPPPAHPQNLPKWQTWDPKAVIPGAKPRHAPCP